jgi:hypothetical protein
MRVCRCYRRNYSNRLPDTLKAHDDGLFLIFLGYFLAFFSQFCLVILYKNTILSSNASTPHTETPEGKVFS